MYYYTFNDHTLLSRNPYPGLLEISEHTAMSRTGNVYILYQSNPLTSRRSFSVTDPSLLLFREEGIHLFQRYHGDMPSISDWLLNKIKQRKVTAVNTSYPSWKNVLDQSFPSQWTIHILGLGDVGGMVTTGLRLLGGEAISKIGIYNQDEKSTKRWEYETNQIFTTDTDKIFPKVYALDEDEIFDCDMFVFCASVGVPPVGEESRDVRTIQFEGNAKIIGHYAKMARDKNYRGIFAVLSDPVDPLCKAAFLASNRDNQGSIDFKGLAPEQIRGYGLGVMHGRAVYYAQQHPDTLPYINEGRAFGPHGKGLVIANSIINYNDEISLSLTERALAANLEVRAAGFKPYIAPALSSGALSIMSTINGSWHYSSTFMGGVFMGAKNRLHPSGTELERLDLPAPLIQRLTETYGGLRNIL